MKSRQKSAAWVNWRCLYVMKVRGHQQLTRTVITQQSETLYQITPQLSTDTIQHIKQCTVQCMLHSIVIHSHYWHYSIGYCISDIFPTLSCRWLSLFMERRSHEAMKSACWQWIVQADGSAVMVWAVFWRILQGPVATLTCTYLVADHLYFFMLPTFLAGDDLFQQDCTQL